MDYLKIISAFLRQKFIFSQITELENVQIVNDFQNKFCWALNGFSIKFIKKNRTFNFCSADLNPKSLCRKGDFSVKKLSNDGNW